MLELDMDMCMLCGGCSSVCPTEAIQVFDSHVEIDQDKCTACSACVKICPVGALELK